MIQTVVVHNTPDAVASRYELVFHGVAVGLSELEGLLFDPHSPHTYCRLCGEVFQTDMERTPEVFADSEFNYEVTNVLGFAKVRRKEWSQRHSRTHPEREHRLLADSGLWLTPEAAHKLAAFGIIPGTDMVLSSEVQAALLESSAIPNDDAEDSA